jgi:PAS domain S-box-containing protein
LDGFWVVDLQGRFIDVNEAYCTIIGYTRNEILGMSIQDVEALETRADIEQRMQKIFTAGTHRFESQHRCKDGHLVDLDICVSYLHDHARLCASLRDITGRNRAAEELRRSHDQLEQRVQERTRALEQANEQMKKVSFELVWAEERERERIAGELHDQVGQSLLLAKMKLDGLSDSIPSDSLRSYAEEASSLVENSIHDIRSLTFRMRPPILDTAGIQTALEWLCSSISNDYNLQVDFSDDGRPKPLTAEVSYALYQAARELLLNVVKHAGTKKAQLTLASDDHTLVVQVTDSGIGFDPPAATAGHAGSIGYGLYNVQQRIEQLGGRFAVESAPGRGTSVALMMPFAES